MKQSSACHPERSEGSPRRLRRGFLAFARNDTLLLAAVLFSIACASGVPIRFGTHRVNAPLVTISNPTFADGDPAAGRRAFVEMQCIDCHRVAEDPKLERGRRAIAGPLLHDLNRYTPKELANRIVSRTTGAAQDLLDKTMKDYTQPLTAQQLVDIVAYLRNPRPRPS